MIYRTKSSIDDVLGRINLLAGDEVRMTVRHCRPVPNSPPSCAAQLSDNSPVPLFSGDRVFVETKTCLYLVTITKSLL